MKPPGQLLQECNGLLDSTAERHGNGSWLWPNTGLFAAAVRPRSDGRSPSLVLGSRSGVDLPG